MRFATFLVALLVVLTAACGGDGPSTEPTATPESRTEAPTPIPGAVTLPIEPAPGAVTKVTYAPGEEIEGVRPDPTGTGPPDGAVFFMNTETGEIEGWYVAAGDFDSSFCGVRGNDRFVTCSSGSGERRAAYLVDRESGEVYQWNPDEIRLLATWPNRVLFEELETGEIGAEPTGRFTLVDDALGTVSSFELPPQRSEGQFFGGRAPHLSPDGERLAIHVDRTVHLIDLTAGSSRAIAEAPEVHQNQRLDSVSLRSTQGTDEIIVIARYSSPAEKPGTLGPPPGVVPRALLRRYSWDGELLSEYSVDGKSVHLSPDGKLIAWENSLHWDSVPVGGIGSALDWPTIVVADAASGEPRFRVRGGAFCYGDVFFADEALGRRWLADSSAVFFATRAGFHVVSIEDSSLRPIPIGGADLFYQFIEPSPDNPDLLAVGRNEFVREGEGGYLLGRLELVDAAGSKRREALLAPSAGGLGHLGPWGSSGREARFSIPHPDHHGGSLCGVGVTPPPKIEFPPFDDDIHLKVAADGGCLNLRDLPLTTANVITCLPDETSMTVTEVSLTEVPSYFSSLEPFVISVSYSDGNRWAHVQTDTGQEGWVSAEFLDWAE